MIPFLLILLVPLLPILFPLLFLHDLINYLLLPLAAQFHVLAIPLDVILSVRILGENLSNYQLGQLMILYKPVMVVIFDVWEDAAQKGSVESEVKQIHYVVVLTGIGLQQVGQKVLPKTLKGDGGRK